MSHVQHSAFVFLLDVASNEKFSSFISEMDLNLIRRMTCRSRHAFKPKLSIPLFLSASSFTWINAE